MKHFSSFFVTIGLVFALLTSALPCGPGYVTPAFDFNKTPQQPYRDFAAGQLGIIKPGFHRSVLFAAYRYLSGGSFSPDDQRALVELWKTTIDHDYAVQDNVGDAVKLWLAKRKDVVSKDEKLPEIYVERSYGGYDFFPNCTANAFEVAAETLASRVSSHGPTDQSVMNWVNAQDQVFQNCSNGRRDPDDVPAGAPEWLEKDRAYQKAAAEFYAMDYRNAKAHFAEIAQDIGSPWQETADYLVARTLIRQASLSKSTAAAAPLYEEAEVHLQRFVSRSGKFSASSERLEGLVKYRLRPKERVSELAKKLAFQPGNENFKQDLVDYTWLLDKFESEALEAEFKRKQAIEAAKNGVKLEPEKPAEVTEDKKAPGDPDEKIQMTIYSDDYAQNWVIVITPKTTDDEALAEAARVVGKPLSDEMKKRVRESRQAAYSGRFSEGITSAYEGGFYSEDPLNITALPAFLRNDDLTDWLFTYQLMSPEAYSYSLKRFNESGSEIWLMTALSKATKASSDVDRLIEAGDRVSTLSPGFQTIAYHRARLLLEKGKNAEAKALIEAVLSGGDSIQIGTRNNFLDLKRRLAATLDEFLTDSLKRPFAFDFGGDVGTIDELIAQQKEYYDPEFNKDGREAFEREVEERYKDEKLWEDRLMFDSETINLMNVTFPQSVLIDIERSPVLPDYLRQKFVIAIWTRAYLLDDMATLLKMTPELAKYDPSFEEQLKPVLAATTQPAMDKAVLTFIVKNPVLSPYLEDGLGKADNEFGQWDSNDWWCSSYLADSDGETTAEAPVLQRPKFLTAQMKLAATAERQKLIAAGDAPALLAKRVLAWARRTPTDKRVPELLYILHEANGWTKYGCGNSEELQLEISTLLRKGYPNSPWTRKLDENKEEQ